MTILHEQSKDEYRSLSFILQSVPQSLHLNMVILFLQIMANAKEITPTRIIIR